MSKREQQEHNHFLGYFLFSKYLGQKYFLRQRYFLPIWSSWMGLISHVHPTCLLMPRNVNQYKSDCDSYYPQTNTVGFRCSPKSLKTSQNITPIKVKRGFSLFFLFLLYLFLMLQRWDCTCCFMIAIKEVPKIIVKLLCPRQFSWPLKLFCFLFDREQTLSSFFLLSSSPEEMQYTCQMEVC